MAKQSPNRASRQGVMYGLIALLIVLPACYAIYQPPLILQFLENKTYDFRFLMRGERQPGTEVVVVGIDEKSLETVGRWPWPRHKMAALLRKMADQHPAVIGVDIIFSEPELSQGEHVLQRITQVLRDKHLLDDGLQHTIDSLRHTISPDQELASVLADYGHAVLALGLLPDDAAAPAKEMAEELYDFAFMAVKEEPFNLPIMAKDALLPVRPILDVVAGAYGGKDGREWIDGVGSFGHVFTFYDRDGAIRKEPLYLKMGDVYLPAFGIEIARLYLGLGREDMQLLAGTAVILGEQVMPTDATGRMMINFAGPVNTFRTVSALDILQGKVSDLQGKILMLGLTALGTTDIHVTPFSRIPGIEKQAAVVENILHHNFMVREEFALLISVVFVLFAAVFLVLLVPKVKAWISALSGLLLLSMYLTGTQYLFVYQRLWVDLMTPVLAVFLLYTVMIAYRFFTEEKKSQQIRQMFSSYTTKKVVDQLLANPELALLGGTNREVTVMFSDVRSFTTFCESRTPEQVIASLNEFLSAMTDVIFAWDGTLDKFVGDEIMAFWGAPAEQKDHAILAFCCTLAMMNKITEMKVDWTNRGLEPLDIGVGLNSGDVVVGNIGCEGKKMDYTIIGDTVNLGARVEAITRNYNDYLIITEFTLAKIKPYLIEDNDGTYSITLEQGSFDKVHVNPLEHVKVKGKDKPVMIYEIALAHWGEPKPKK